MPVRAEGLPPAERVKGEARRAARESRPWVEGLGRLGHAAHGVVYGIVGLLAARAALGTGGATTDPEGALAWIVQAPFGRLLLGAIAAGLAGYALWRFVEAGLHSDGRGEDAKRVAACVWRVVNGLIHLGLALSALGLSPGRGGAVGSDEAARDWTTRLLEYPFGQGLVALVGLVVLGVGVLQLRCAYTASFRGELELAAMTAEQQQLATRLGRLGFGARGIVFLIVGGFLMAAALHARPEEARGLGGALATLVAQPYGPWLLGIVAAGLLCYAAFSLAEARFRRMPLG
jgi:hypothetical protein